MQLLADIQAHPLAMLLWFAVLALVLWAVARSSAPEHPRKRNAQRLEELASAREARPEVLEMHPAAQVSNGPYGPQVRFQCSQCGLILSILGQPEIIGDPPVCALCRVEPRWWIDPEKAARFDPANLRRPSV